MPIATTPTYEEDFDRVLKQQAQGREIHKIRVSFNLNFWEKNH